VLGRESLRFVLDPLVKLRKTEVDVLTVLIETDDWEAKVVATVECVEELTGQISILTLLVSSVTDPLKANTPPFEMAAVFNVTEIAAKMFPTKKLPVPKVAELPTCQYTLEGNAPPVSRMLEPVAVTKELPIRKYQTSLNEPVPASVKTPVTAAELLKLYVPGTNFMPPDRQSKVSLHLDEPMRCTLLLHH
jgi:hypothetical protein